MDGQDGHERILYVFIDESGDFYFSPQGSKYLILTGLATFDPILQREKLIKLRYKLLAEGYDQAYFHATEDKQFVRDQVFALLHEIGNSYEVHSVYAQKNKANPTLYEETYKKKGRTLKRHNGIALYQKLCECLLKYLFRGKDGAVDKIVVVLSSLYTGQKKRTLIGTLKGYLKMLFPGIPFEIYSQQAQVDLNCQLADYCCWAIHVKHQRNELRPYQMIKSQVKNEFHFLGPGNTIYYI